MKAFVRISTEADCETVSANMRKADIEEIRANSNSKPIDALRLGLAYSQPCFTIVTEDLDPVAMFGVCPVRRASPKTGQIWMLGTDKMWDIRFDLVKKVSLWLDAITKSYDFVYNVIDKRNRVHIKFIKRLGFQLIREIPEYGHGRLPFIEFVRYKNV